MWNDLNKDHLQDNGELGLGGWTVFVDLKGDGQNDPGDPTATTASDGSYSIQVPAAQQTTTNTYKVYEVLQSGWAETYPIQVTSQVYDSVTVSGGQTSAANNFGDHYTLNPAVKTITLAATSQTPTNAASVQFVVTFSEPVTGADKEVSGVYSDFQLVPVGPSGAWSPMLSRAARLKSTTAPPTARPSR